MQRKVGWGIANLVLRIFWIVAPEKCPGALPPLTVDVFHPWCTRLFGQDCHVWLQRLASEGRGKTIEIRDHLAVILDQHRCHRIDLGAEVEESVRAEGLTALGRVHLVTIDVGVYRCRRAQLELRVVKRERTVPLHSRS